MVCARLSTYAVLMKSVCVVCACGAGGVKIWFRVAIKCKIILK